MTTCQKRRPCQIAIALITVNFGEDALQVSRQSDRGKHNKLNYCVLVTIKNDLREKIGSKSQKMTFPVVMSILSNTWPESARIFDDGGRRDSTSLT